MQAYSADLCERVAARFGVSVSFVHQLEQRPRTRGTLAALPHRGGPAPWLTAVADRRG